MKLKMDNRPYLSSRYNSELEICLKPQKSVTINNTYKQLIHINESAKKIKIVLVIKSKNPNDNINVRIDMDALKSFDIEVNPLYCDYQEIDNILSVQKIIQKTRRMITNGAFFSQNINPSSVYRAYPRRV